MATEAKVAISPAPAPARDLAGGARPLSSATPARDFVSGESTPHGAGESAADGSASASPGVGGGLRAAAPRGLFIVLEGLDRTGKTTQARRLTEALNRATPGAAHCQPFPDRSTPIGALLSGYLASATDCEKHAVHLLFSANRWECAPRIERLLREGVHVVADRYSYSGVAYSAAKGLDFQWCAEADQGLPVPDVVLFLVADADALRARAGFGRERYETEEMQRAVAAAYMRLCTPAWTVIDAGAAEGAVAARIWEAVRTRLARDRNLRPDRPDSTEPSSPSLPAAQPL
jgi:dTMP kinase